MTSSVILTLQGITVLYKLGRLLAPRLAEVGWVGALKGAGQSARRAATANETGIRRGGVAVGLAVGTLGGVFASGLVLGVLFAPARGTDLRRSLRDWVEQRRSGSPPEGRHPQMHPRSAELDAPVVDPRT